MSGLARDYIAWYREMIVGSSLTTSRWFNALSKQGQYAVAFDAWHRWSSNG